MTPLSPAEMSVGTTGEFLPETPGPRPKENLIGSPSHGGVTISSEREPGPPPLTPAQRATHYIPGAAPAAPAWDG